MFLVSKRTGEEVWTIFSVPNERPEKDFFLTEHSLRDDASTPLPREHVRRLRLPPGFTPLRLATAATALENEVSQRSEDASSDASRQEVADELMGARQRFRILRWVFWRERVRLVCRGFRDDGACSERAIL